MRPVARPAACCSSGPSPPPGTRRPRAGQPGGAPPPRSPRRRRVRRRSARRSERCRDATPTTPEPRRACRRGSRPRRPRPRALLPASSPPPARARHPPRASSPRDAARSHRSRRGAPARSSRQCSQHAPAREREERDREEAQAPRGRGHEQAEQRGVERARAVQQRSAAARSPRRSAGGRPARPQRRRRGRSSSSRARRPTTSVGMSTRSGAPRNTPVRLTAIATASAIVRSGRSRLPTASDQRPAPMRAAIPSACTTASTAAAVPGVRPRWSCRKSTVKPTTHICGASTSALPADTRQMRGSRSGATSVGPAGAGADAFPEHEPAEGRSDEARAAHRREAEAGAAVPRDRRQRNRRDEAADRDRRLPDPEGEPPLRGGKPGHHGAPARGLHARAGKTREHQQQQQWQEALDARRCDEGRAATPDPDHQHRPLAEPVGRQPPGDQAQHGAGERRRDQHARLTQGQPVLVAQERRHHRNAEPDRRVRRLRERPRSEDDPAVTGYRPNGFVGRVPVYVTTDFVSR